MSLTKVLEANGEDDRHSQFAGGERELAHSRIVRTKAPLRRVGTNRWSAGGLGITQGAFPSRPVWADRRHGFETRREWLQRGEQLAVAGCRVSIEDRGQMTDPRTLQLFAIEH